MAAIFVSYATKDQAAADRVVSGLEQCGLSCWICSRDIKPGADYQASIVQALQQAEVVLLLLSQAANESVEVPKEMSLAGSLRKPVIPARIENVGPSGALAYQATHAQYVDLFRGFDAKLQDLCLHLGERLQASGAVAAQLQRVARARAVRRWLTAGGLAIIVAVGGGLVAARLPELRTMLARRGAAPAAAVAPPVPAAAPSPAAQAPSAADDDAAALGFTDRYFAAMAGAPDAAADFLNRVVTDPVRFYGQTVSRTRMIANQQTYMARWPERGFTIRKPSVVVSCSAGGAVCVVSGVLDYRLRSAARGAASDGAETFTLRLVAQDGGVQVAEMTSQKIQAR
jgi:hypothetical protein